MKEVTIVIRIDEVGNIVGSLKKLKGFQPGISKTFELAGIYGYLFFNETQKIQNQQSFSKQLK